MTDKPKFPRALALQVAKELCDLLRPACLPDYLKVCGSLRRGLEEVGDVEIVYVSKSVEVPDGLFDTIEKSEAEMVLGYLLNSGVLKQRANVRGHTTWGEKNKLAVHVATGVPVDLFAATVENWWNYVVCRTGGLANNLKIATEANARGLNWRPYDAGFTDSAGRLLRVECEQDVFRLVGLKYLEPRER